MKYIKISTTFISDEDKKIKNEINGDETWADICASDYMFEVKENKDAD